MIRLDTLSIEIPSPVVRGVQWDAFTETMKSDMKTGQTETFRQGKSSYLPVGVSQIKYKEGGDYQITISAKTLHDEYLEGININNWDSAVNGVSQILDIDINQLWDCNPKVFRCDTTDNISLGSVQASQKEVCEALYSNKMNDRFVSKWYESKTKLGVEFAGTQQEKNRLICYSKNLDLMKKENKEFMQSLKNPLKMWNDAEKIIRVETNHTSFQSMRNRFDVDENNLQSILKSGAKVNRDFLKKILNTRSDQLSMFEQFRQMNLDAYSFIYMKGIESIVYEFGCNEKAIKVFLKQIFGDRFGYVYYKSSTPLKNIVRQIKASQNVEVKSDTTTICNRLLSELAVA